MSNRYSVDYEDAKANGTEVTRYLNAWGNFTVLLKCIQKPWQSYFNPDKDFKISCFQFLTLLCR